MYIKIITTYYLIIYCFMSLIKNSHHQITQLYINCKSVNCELLDDFLAINHVNTLRAGLRQLAAAEVIPFTI